MVIDIFMRKKADYILNLEQLLIDICISYCIGKEIDDQFIKDESINWMDLIQLASTQKVLPIVYKMLENKKFKYKVVLKYFWDIHVKRIRGAIVQAKELISSMENKNYCISKGFILSQLLYDDVYIRMFGDLDIHVSSKEMMWHCLNCVQFKMSVLL